MFTDTSLSECDVTDELAEADQEEVESSPRDKSSIESGRSKKKKKRGINHTEVQFHFLD